MIDRDRDRERDLYDWLRARGVLDPAVGMIGSRFVLGRWEVVNETLPNGYICRVGKVGVLVLGESETSWSDARDKAIAKLEAPLLVIEPTPGVRSLTEAEAKANGYYIPQQHVTVLVVK